MEETFFEKAISYYTNEPVDIPKAIEYFEKAANIDADSFAMKLLIDIYKDEIKNEEQEKYWNDRFFNTLDDYEKGKFYFKNNNHKEGINWYKKSADNGNSNAMFRLGLLYHDGEEVEANLDKSFYYFDLAAQQNHRDGLFSCALFYHKGLIDNEPNFEKAFNYAKKAADLDDEKALHLVGSYYENGIFVEKNIEIAYEYYLRSYDLDFPYALPFKDRNEIFNQHVDPELHKIRTWLSTEKHQEAMEWYDLAVENNDIDAIMDLGLMYFYGYNVQEDFEKSFAYFTKSILSDNAKALFYAGLLYDQGYIGEDSNIEKALPFMLKASELGYAEAQYHLGNYYEMGFDAIGGQENPEKSFEFYSKAALVGFRKTMGILGDAYRYGYGVEENIEKAFYWYFQGAALKDYASINSLIICYKNGIGVQKNETEAEYWFEIVKNIENPGYLN